MAYFSGTNTWSFDFETHVLTLAEEALQIKERRLLKITRENRGFMETVEY